MCDVCYCSKCPPGCPGYEPEEAIYTCEHCGGGIYEGEEYMRYKDTYYHGDCLTDMSGSEIAEIFDLKIEEACINA